MLESSFRSEEGGVASLVRARPQTVGAGVCACDTDGFPLGGLRGDQNIIAMRYDRFYFGPLKFLRGLTAFVFVD
jgi:hypothetical protein